MRPIDADALMQSINSDTMVSAVLEEVIDEQPTIEAVPVVHGRWKNIMGRPLECSVCGIITNPINDIPWANRSFNYCPHCGAKMDEVSE